MNALPPNTRFSLFGARFKVDCINADKVRFSNLSDTYDVWEMSETWLLDKLSTGRLKIILTTTNTIKEATQ